MTILALTAGLAGILGFHIGLALDRFLIGDLRRTDVRFDLELPQQTVDDDLQMASFIRAMPIFS